MKLQNLVSAVVLSTVVMCNNGLAIDLFGGSNSSGPKKTSKITQDIGKGCDRCCAQWCPDSYRIKYFPCVALPKPCGCGDTYCPKPAPCVSLNSPCGGCDRYCPKPFPCVSRWRPSLHNGKCPPPVECIPSGSQHVNVLRLPTLKEICPTNVKLAHPPAIRK